MGTHSPFWPSGYKCPVCGGAARGGDGAYGVRVMRILEPQEGFVALEGLGLPEELECSEEEVQRVLTASPITYVQTNLVGGSDRVYIEWVRLADGKRIYFCASAWGAAVHRMVLPRKTS